ncbi:MAG TPA: rhodanese-like domain-containing protein [Syntrophorhabdaceae bacterium]|jgi:thiosulfate/3-mercaptopyruvate sulfurtransferase
MIPGYRSFHYIRLTPLIAWAIIMLISSMAAAEGPDEKSFAPGAKGFPNGELLVSAEWLQANLKDKELALIDTRSQGYEQSHIPRAVNLRFEKFKAAAGAMDVAKLEELLTSAGLQRNTKIVLYGDPSESPGSTGWFFWFLEALGCTDVHILDGGWARWTAAGGSAETETKAGSGGAKFVAALNGRLAPQARYVSARAGKDNFTLIDGRTIEEFNGWQLHGELRGGHIPGAINLDYRDFYDADGTVRQFKEVKTLLESKGVTGDKETVSYCTDGRRSGSVYFALRLMGHARASALNGSILEWSRDPTLPMEKLARYEKLVYPAWVKALIDGKNPPTYKGKKYMILEVRYNSFSISQMITRKEAGYIPGAVSIHPCYVEHGNDVKKYYPDYVVPDDAKLLPDDQLQKALMDLGITRDAMVIVYSSGRVIPMTASRVAWALMYAGVEDVRVLNGGYSAWERAGYPVAAKAMEPTPVADFGAKVPLRPELYATTGYIRSMVKGENPSAILLDVRKRDEFDGKTNPYPFFTRKGRIPGAVWQGDWDALVNTKDDTYRTYPEVQRLWKGLGGTPDKELVFYCGTGWRSTIGFFQAYLMGYDRIRNYDGSFYVWSADESNPVVRPDQK